MQAEKIYFAFVFRYATFILRLALFRSRFNTNKLKKNPVLAFVQLYVYCVNPNTRLPNGHQTYLPKKKLIEFTTLA